MTKEVWNLSKSEQAVALVALALSLAARGLALLPAYAIDDYNYLVADAIPSQLNQGRLGAVALRDILRLLGAQPPNSGMLGTIVLTLTLVWVGILVCRIWRIEKLPVLSGLVTLLICLHPYQSEIFTFRGAGLMLAVALGLGFLGLSTCCDSLRSGIAAVLMMAASLLTYQVTLNYLGIVLFFSFVLHIARRRDGGEAESIGAGRVLRSQLVAFLLAVACSTLVTLAIPFLFGIPLGQRTNLLKVSGVGARCVLALRQLRIMFAAGEPVLPIATKALLVLAPLLAVAVAVFRSTGALKEWTSRRGIPFLLAVAGGVPLSLGVVLILQEWWPVPRVCSHIGVFWGGIFALVYTSVPLASRRVLIVLSGVILFSFIGLNNRIFSDQIRVNRRDRATANRIIARLETLPEFSPIGNIVVVGGRWGFFSPISTVEGDMNISALFAEWSKISLLNEVSGFSLQPAPPDDMEKARAYCVAVPPWPSPQAVIRLDSFVVVCQAN